GTGGIVVSSTSLLPYLNGSSNNATDIGAYGSAWKNIYASSTAYLDYVSSTAMDATTLNLTSSSTLTLTASTTDANTGVIYKGTERFIHNFSHPTGSSAIPNGQNTFVGLQSGNFTMGSGATSVVQGSYNTGVGYKALNSLTSGSYNTANGASALYNNTTGIQNTAIGAIALYSNTGGSYNVAIGRGALNSNTDSSNTAIGAHALYSNTTGGYNTANGTEALYYNTTGVDNTALGFQAGRYIANGTTANQFSKEGVYIGWNTKSLVSDTTNEIVIGYNAIGKGDNSVVLGADTITDTWLKGSTSIIASTTALLGYKNGSYNNVTDLGAYGSAWKSIYASSTITFSNLAGITDIGADSGGKLQAASDERLKKNIVTIDNALEKVMGLRGVYYNWKTSEEGNWYNSFDENERFVGLIAQEVVEAVPELAYVHETEDVWAVRKSDVVGLLIEAIKEQQANIEELENRINVLTLDGNLADMTSQDLEQQLLGIKVEFEGDILVKGHVNFSGDTVGQAKILAGDTSVKIDFASDYEYQPIVNISKLTKFDGDYWVSTTTVSGFYIEISAPQDSDINFNWNAFGANDAKVFSSDGTTSTVDVIFDEVNAIDDFSPYEGELEGVVEPPVDGGITTSTTTEPVVDAPPAEGPSVDEGITTTSTDLTVNLSTVEITTTTTFQ
ncbi:MAG: tail fiber domain-containing protein, partial [bacterium]|nr:tail fiber domain-containing protein [bacterium]